MKRLTPAEYVGLIRKCKSLGEAEQVHSRLVGDGLDRDTYLGNHLVQLYGAYRSLKDAYKVFHKLHSRNVFSWNIIIAACIQNEKMDQARKLFEDSPKRDVVTWNAMITGYAHIGYLGEARNVFGKMANHNVSSLNSMVTLFAKNNRMSEAKELFDGMPERNLISWHAVIVAHAHWGDVEGACCSFHKMAMQTVVSWNTVISAHLQNESFDGANLYFEKMPEKDSISWNSMITACAQGGHLKKASKIFQDMPEEERSLSSWNSMISGLVQNENLVEARRVFDIMDERNPVTWNTMITAYARTGHVEEAKALYERMVQPDMATSTSMLLAYAYTGRVSEALEVFERMPEKDVASWSAIMTSHVQNGHSEKALILFKLRDLEGIPLDRSSFIIILEACTSLSSLSMGKVIHSCVCDAGFDKDVSVGNALVSLYGKCACLGDAERVFGDMTEKTVVSWNSLMTAYAQNGYAMESLHLGRCLMLDGVQPDFITFINILSACSHEGLWRDGRSYFMSMECDHGVEVTVEHYHCMIDLLARSGNLSMAASLIHSMPFNLDDISLRSLLSAAHVYKDVDTGAWAVEQLQALNLATTSEYVMLANIYKNFL